VVGTVLVSGSSIQQPRSIDGPEDAQDYTGSLDGTRCLGLGKDDAINNVKAALLNCSRPECRTREENLNTLKGAGLARR
jgi:hypothetical protein